MRDKKQIRIALLNKETDLYQNNCESCKVKHSNNSNQNCVNCEIFKELRQIGDELLSLNSKEMPALEITKEEREMGLTVDRYKQLKEKGHTDKQIMKEFGYHIQKFYAWKRENGLIGDSKYSNQKNKVTAPESDFKPVPPTSNEDKLKFELKENERLRTENEKLQRDLKEHIVEIESLEEKVRSYEEQIEKFKNKLSTHVQRISELNSLNRAIKERNEELLLKIKELEDVSNQEENSSLAKLTKALLEYALDVTS